jgi:hypothetical protein
MLKSRPKSPPVRLPLEEALSDPRFSQLRASILARPGMYFGTTDPAADAVSPLLSSWCHQLLVAGARELSIALRQSGHIDVTHRGTNNSARNRDVIGASSELFEERVDSAQTKVSFRFDTRAFPMLQVREPYRLSTALRDAATTFPGAVIELFDEAHDLQMRVRYPRGSADRLLEEAGTRQLNHPFHFVGSAGPVRFDVAFSWCNGPGLQVVALTNSWRNANGGAHVYGIWEGIAAALSPLLGATIEKPFAPETLPRNAVVVVSVHLEDPRFGPATRDCLHDARARQAIRDALQHGFVAQLGQAGLEANTPPWQALGGVHGDTPWLRRFADFWSDGLLDGVADLDPWAHHEHHGAQGGRGTRLRAATIPPVRQPRRPR